MNLIHAELPPSEHKFYTGKSAQIKNSVASDFLFMFTRKKFHDYETVEEEQNQLILIDYIRHSKNEAHK